MAIAKAFRNESDFHLKIFHNIVKHLIQFEKILRVETRAGFYSDRYKVSKV